MQLLVLLFGETIAIYVVAGAVRDHRSPVGRSVRAYSSGIALWAPR